MVSDLGGDPRVTQVYGDFSPAKERPQATSTVLWAQHHPAGWLHPPGQAAEYHDGS